MGATLSLGGHPSEKTMRRWSQFVAVLLLLAGGSRAMADPATWRVSSAAATCHQHEHGKQGIPSTPPNTLCCVAGHGSAMLKALWVPQASMLAAQLISFVDIRPEGVISFHPTVLIPTSGDPPGASPLRV